MRRTVRYQSDFERFSRILERERVIAKIYDIPARQKSLKPTRWHKDAIVCGKRIKLLTEIVNGLKPITIERKP